MEYRKASGVILSLICVTYLKNELLSVTYQWRRWAAGKSTHPLLFSSSNDYSPAPSGPTAPQSRLMCLQTPIWPFQG